MKTLKELALEAWSQEQEKRKQSDYKKRKRLAKKIEGEIDDLLPKDADDYAFERDLEDKRYGVVVSIGETGGALRFTHDDKDRLAIIGECPACRGEALSKPVEDMADLGQLLESFQPGASHDCPIKRS
ncbi:MAG: hypothetical protein V7641_2558 [Blastocatellia bacterium]